MLNNFTLIILTYNRYNYLQRNLEFYLEYKLKFKIIILDSSTIVITKNIKNLIDNNNNVKLFKLDSNIDFFAIFIEVVIFN